MTTATIGRRAALAATIGALAAPRLATAQAPHRVRFTFDWALHGAYAFGVAAERNGIFRKHNLEMPINRGFGSGRVPIDIAAGTYDLGFGDLTPMLRFMAENPQRELVCVGVLYDQSPSCCTVRADGPIREPKMLEGKTLAAPEFDGGRQIFPVFAQAVGINLSSITWMSVAPDLREPMLVQRRADGITGFITSTGLSLKALGMDWPAQRIFRYRDFGLPFYGSGLVTTRAFMREKPEALRAAIAALTEGMIWAYKNPAAAIEQLKARESLTDVAIETERQQVAFNEMMLSDEVRQHGLSYVTAPRLQAQIDAMAAAFNLTAQKPSVATAFTDEFLPPRDARML
ncbi:ABC transporter substrate-binding protein [Roseomonas sp. CCTCC AB2023176]|uniref:ABC transporter substrate-binding protein n=1 Tax=Roseomonas sp. CCTCC AB2023176 TaxID=3342640 RepID=UPI0035E258E6